MPCFLRLSFAFLRAIANIQEAIELYLEVLQEEGRVIPEDQVETVTLHRMGEFSRIYLFA